MVGHQGLAPLGHKVLRVTIKEARVAKGWTQAELAIRVGTTQASVSRQENKARSITIPTLERYAKALGCKALSLIKELP